MKKGKVIPRIHDFLIDSAENEDLPLEFMSSDDLWELFAENNPEFEENRLVKKLFFQILELYS